MPMQTSVERTIDKMIQAWNDGNAAAYARLFTDDATYVIFAGAVSRGREAIRRDHETVLAKYQKGQPDARIYHRHPLPRR